MNPLSVLVTFPDVGSNAKARPLLWKRSGAAADSGAVTGGIHQWSQ